MPNLESPSSKAVDLDDRASSLPTTKRSQTSQKPHKMPSQRPTFFANFLTAFRAHSAIPSAQAKSSSTSPVSQNSHSTSTSQPSNNTNHASTPRTIHSSTKPSGATTTALGQLVSPRTHSTSPLSRTPGSPGFSSPNASTSHHHPKTRRGSDSSSEGFRDVIGAEKWYIGGRTAAGEERYFKLGVVKRHRSVDRLSLDRLSL